MSSPPIPPGPRVRNAPYAAGAKRDLTLLDEEQLWIAADAHERYGKGRGHPAGLNFGDAFAYALAVVRRLSLLFKGDDFARTDIVRAV